MAGEYAGRVLIKGGIPADQSLFYYNIKRLYKSTAPLQTVQSNPVSMVLSVINSVWKKRFLV